MTQEDLSNKALGICTEIFKELTESIKMKKSIALKYESALSEIEKAELIKLREELVQKWEAKLESALEAFAAVTFLKSEIQRIDNKLEKKEAV